MIILSYCKQRERRGLCYLGALSHGKLTEQAGLLAERTMGGNPIREMFDLRIALELSSKSDLK